MCEKEVVLDIRVSFSFFEMRSLNFFVAIEILSTLFFFLSLTRLPSEKDSDKLNISLEKILVCRCILILDSHD